MNSYVYALAWDGTNLYAGGNFTTAGGGSANRIAKWNGSAWSALGTGMESNTTVNALAWDGTNLYAGGNFTTAGGVTVNRIAKWSGSTWSALGSGMDGAVNALAWDGTNLYAGGSFTTAGGVSAGRIAKWGGSAWSALGSGMDGSVLTLAWDGTVLHAGGSFPTAGGVSANRMANWDGSAWSALGSGMNNTTYALACEGTNFYAGGDFTTAGGKVSGYIARWAPSSSCATPIVPAITSAADADDCAYSGVLVTWSADATDWGDVGVGTRTYDVLRDGTAAGSGIAYGTTQYTDTTGANGTTYAYTVRYHNGCGMNAETTGADAADLNGTPGVPGITGILDVNACAQSGIQVNYSAGAGADSHDLYKDGALAASPYASGATYAPGDVSSHAYVVRAVSGACSADSSSQDATDVNNGPGAPSITGITDVSACAQSGIQITYTGGSGAVSHDLYRDGVSVVTGYVSGATYDPADTAGHTYIVRANNAECSTDSPAQAAADADDTPGAPSITGIADVSPCTQSGIQVTYTAGSGALSHDLHRDGSPVVTGYVSGATYEPGDTAVHTYIVRAIHGGCFSESAPQDGTDAKVDEAPGAPAITGILDVSACAQSGIQISYTAGSGAVSHDLYRDGSPVVTGYVSGAPYNPGGTGSHIYVVRAVNAFCYMDSLGLPFVDSAGPTPTVTGPSPACGSASLGTQVFSSYQWYRNGSIISGATDQNYDAIVPGTYTVKVTDGTGCQATSPGFAVSSNPSTPAISGPDAGCDSAMLSTGVYTSYQWIKDGSDIVGATGQTYPATESGTYRVRVSNAAGCTATSIGKSVTINPLPIPAISGPAAICPGDTALLETGTFSSYQWIRGGEDIAGATSQTYGASLAGTYSVRVTDGNNCEGTSAGHPLAVHPLPTLSGPAQICFGQAALLTAGTFSSYQWVKDGLDIPGATSQDYSATEAGLYAVRVTDTYGCTSTSAGHALAVLDPPTPSISGGTTGCASPGVPLSTQVYSSYQWIKDGLDIPAATAQSYLATQSGTYAVRVTDGCTATSPGHTVTISSNPTITGDHLNSCPDVSVILSTGDYVGYQWYFNGAPIPGATSRDYAATVSGNYSVWAEIGEGCTAMSIEHVVFIDFCSGSEVSPQNGIFPLQIGKDTGSSTGYYIYFQRLDTLDGYNIYSGNIGTWYSHADAPGNDCAAMVSDLGMGEMRAELNPSEGDHYYLITAYGGGAEGPSGFDSQSVEIPAVQSTCAP
jgi:hypothetical protein